MTKEESYQTVYLATEYYYRTCQRLEYQKNSPMGSHFQTQRTDAFKKLSAAIEKARPFLNQQTELPTNDN